MSLLNKKISELPFFNKNSISNTFMEISSNLTSFKTSVVNFILWISKYLYNNFSQMKPSGCNNLIDVINYCIDHASESNNLYLNDLLDVKTTGLLNKQQLRYTGNKWWINDGTLPTPSESSQFFYDERNITFDYTYKTNKHTGWVATTPLPKINSETYDENCTIEIFNDYLYYGVTPNKCWISDDANGKNFNFSITPHIGIFNVYGDPGKIPFKIRFWKQNPEIEKIPTIGPDEGNVTWIKSQIPGNELGEFAVYFPYLILSHNKILSNGKIDSEHALDEDKITEEIPFLAASSIEVFCSESTWYSVFGTNIHIKRIGFYNKNHEPIGALDYEGNSELKSDILMLLPNLTWSINEINQRKSLLNNAKYIRIYIVDNSKPDSQHTITHIYPVIQHFLPVGQTEKFDTYYKYLPEKGYDHSRIYFNNYITNKFGREDLPNIIRANQMRSEAKLYPNTKLDLVSGETVPDSKAATTDFIPVREFVAGGTSVILSTIKMTGSTASIDGQPIESPDPKKWAHIEAKLVCTYDENKSYNGCFYNYYTDKDNNYSFIFDSRALRLDQHFSPGGGTTGSIKYIRYTISEVSAINQNGLVYSPDPD